MTGRAPALSARAILASAGSGKTFQLSSEYVRLLVRGAPVERVLATTFTRKAAGEIFDRVLGRLAEAAASDVKAHELGAFIGEHSLTSARCLDVLASFVLSLHRARIGTIDAFFARLASAFAMDIDAPLGWTIASEDVRRVLHQRSVEATVERTSAEEMTQLLRSLQHGGFPSKVAAEIEKEVRRAHDLALKTTPESWSVVPKVVEEAARPPIEFHRDLELLSAQPAIPDGKSDEHGHLRTGRDNLVRDARAGLYARVACSLLARAAFQPGGTYRGCRLAPTMAERIRRIAEWCASNALKEVRESNKALRSLADRYGESLQTLKHELGLLEFEDVPRMLLRANAVGDLSELYYRLDSRLDHILLDEFQDTSIEQFELLRPMLEEILSGGEGVIDRSEVTARAGRSVFLVGDIKQSMYAWRDAEPELFAGVLEQWPQLHQEELHKSHRSSQVVLDAVNAVFGDLGSNQAFSSASDRETARRWSSEFVPHVAAKNLPGQVRVHVASEPGEGAEGARHRLRAAADRIVEISKTAPRASVGVLMPTRRHIAKIMHELKLRGLNASEEGGNPLTDSAAVAAVLSALQMIDHPGDTAARFHVATTPAGDYLGVRDWRSEKMACEFSARARRLIGDRGLAHVLRMWRAGVASRSSRRDVDRLAQLVQLAEQHDVSGTTRQRDFIELVRARRVESPLAERVRVMTIHKSKGLEFDAVVLPDLDVDMLRSGGLVLRRKGVFSPIDAVSRYPNEDLRTICPDLDEMYAATRERDLRERICVLYVAMTRARHSLDMFIDVPRGRNSLRYSQIVRGALRVANEAPEGTTAFERGDHEWTKSFRAATDRTRGFSPIRIQQPLPRTTPTRRLVFVSPSSLHAFARETPVARSEVSRSIDGRAARLGTLMHTALERIEWLDHSTPRVEELISSLNCVDDIEARAVHDVLSAAMTHAAATGVLSPDRYAAWGAERVVAHCEVPMAARVPSTTTGRDSLVLGTVDRLVVGFRDGRAIAAEVVDYKSDTIDWADVVERTRTYAPQVDAYRAVVAAQFGVDLSRVRGTLFFVRTGRLMSWPSDGTRCP